MKPLSQQDILEFLKAHQQTLKETYHLSKIGLFGSFARGEANETSDIDLLIELEVGTPNIYELKLQLQEFLQAQFQRSIDLAREKYLKPYVRQQILQETIYVVS